MGALLTRASLVVCLLLLSLGLAGTGRADFACATTVARQGESALGDGTFLHFAGIALNDAGLVAFAADRVKGGAPGVFVRPSVGTTGPIAALARKGQPAPGGGTFSGAFSVPSINRHGTAAFAAGTIGAAGGAVGVFFSGTSGALRVVALAGASAPRCGGRFARLGAPAIDGDGAIAFTASLTGGTAPSGVFVVLADGSASAVACADVATSLADASVVELDDFADVATSDGGAIAFVASVASAADGAYVDALYRFDRASGRIAEIVRVGAPAPDLAGSNFYELFSPPAISTAGVSFRAFVTGAAYQGIFFRSGAGAIATVVVRGDPVPDASGTRFKRFMPPSMNAAGDLAVQADNLGAAPRHEVIFIPARGAPETVAAESQAAPGAEPGALFENFKRPVLNDGDAVAFAASLSGGRGRSSGVFLCERR